MAVIGIDLGTTNSLVVAYKDGKTIMIPNQFQEYLTPSVVSVNEDGEVIVGKIARERLITHAKSTANLFKRSMGTEKVAYLGNRKFLPEEFSACVVKQLIDDAEVFLNEKVEEAIISVPAYFNAKQRRATKKIGALLGIKVERLINEPSAAAIACHQSDAYETFVVFDFGGGTLDVSVVDCFDNVVSICAIAGDNQLGGSDFDLEIAKYFCKQNNLSFRDLKTAMQRSILMQAEKVKLGLQEKEQMDMNIHMDGKDYSTTFTIDILRDISTPIFVKLKGVIGKAVKDSGFTLEELSSLIMVGGSSYMPVVQDYLEALLRLPIVHQGEIDTLVAKGLGGYIGIKIRDEASKDLVVTDVCPFSLTTGIINRLQPINTLSKVIIPKNSVLPSSFKTDLATAEFGQTELLIEVFQGEALYTKDNFFLGRTTVIVPKNLENKEVFQITYSYDINSILFIEIYIYSTKEHLIFTLGDNEDLIKVEDRRALESIKNISLQLHKNDKLELLRARALRIYEEVDEYVKEGLVRQIQQFEKTISGSDNNIRKRLELMDQFNTMLDRFEEVSSVDNLDIFESNEYKDDDEGMLS
jgi:molecular chaperone HscC